MTLPPGNMALQPAFSKPVIASGGRIVCEGGFAGGGYAAAMRVDRASTPRAVPATTRRAGSVTVTVVP